MASSLTIFWIELTDSDAAIIEHVGRHHGASIVPVKMYSLAALAFAAQAVGPVVFVARSDQEASRALSMGVDEVIRTGEISEERLSETIARASSRAAARSSYEMRRGLFQDDDELALAALVAGFGRQLCPPLADASLGCELLASALSTVLDVSDDFVGWASLAGPIDQARQLAARRLALPASRELKDNLDHVTAALQRASWLARSLARLSAVSGANTPSPVAPLVAEVVDIMRADYAAWATITIRSEGPCAVCVAPVTVAKVVSALIINAMDAIRAAKRDPGTVEVRLSQHEDAVLLEVQDDGLPGPTDLRPRMSELSFSVDRAGRTGLARLRERLRRCGADLLVDTDESGTTVRVLLPATAKDVVLTAPPAPAATMAKRRPPSSD